MIILRPLLLLTNLHLKLLSTQGTGADKLLSTQRVKLDKSYFESYFIEIDKNVFKLKSNVIIGALYKPPNVSIDID